MEYNSIILLLLLYTIVKHISNIYYYTLIFMIDNHDTDKC